LYWNEKSILLTGGTGSFGQKFTEIMLGKYNPRVVRIYSRDELKQWEMKKRFNNAENLRFFVGDIRDKERLHRALDDIDIVIHAAALKQVPSCEYNPFEAIKTNIFGAQNIIDSAIDHNVERVIAISTDKAVNPVNLYGATKLCMEKLFVAANSYVGGKRRTRMACVRYGNVIGSRGSIVPLLQEQKKTGKITITHKDMTRFWITLKQGVECVIRCVMLMQGGEVFIPKASSMNILDMVKVIAPDCTIEFIGIRPGEKIDECLLTEDEARHSLEFEDLFVIEPEHPWWEAKKLEGGTPLPQSYRYTSSSNSEWLSLEQFREILEES